MLQLPKLGKSMISIGNVSLIGYIGKTHKCFHNNCSWSKKMRFSENYEMDSETDEKEQRKKTVRIPKITLIHPDKSIRVTSLDAAEKLAKRRDLKLVEVSNQDAKSDRDVYKLLTSTEYLQVEQKGTSFIFQEPYNTKNHVKTTKLFNIKAVIANHDLDIKINHINLLLKKGHKIKIILSHPDGREENVLKSLNEKIKGTVTLKKLERTVTTLIFSVPASDGCST